jgi:hypothetical protein
VERYRRVGVLCIPLEVEGSVEVEARVAAAGARRAPDGIDDGTMPAETAARNLGTRRMFVCGKDNSIGGLLRLACSRAAAATSELQPKFLDTGLPQSMVGLPGVSHRFRQMGVAWPTMPGAPSRPWTKVKKLWLGIG